MKTITVELSPRSINSALRKLEPYINGLDDKLDLVCEKLAAIGKAEADMHIAGADSFCNVDAYVTPEPIENGYKLVGSGEDIGFIEFGAGWAAGAGHPYAGSAPYAVYPGSYSEENTKEYAKYGSWHYQGVKMTHLLPEMPMYYAVLEMRRKLPEVVQEVFK